MDPEGGCACGAVRYRLTAAPLIVHACHCRDCQKQTGSAFVLNMWIEKNCVEADHSAPKSFMLSAASGKPHEVFFCGNCMTRLWSKYHAAPRRYIARPGRDSRSSGTGRARRAHIHQKQVAVVRTAGGQARLRGVLQAPGGLAGRQSGAAAPQYRRPDLTRTFNRRAGPGGAGSGRPWARCLCRFRGGTSFGSRRSSTMPGPSSRHWRRRCARPFPS